MKTTILFDLDGTLIDSTEAILDSFYYACNKCAQIKPTKEDIVRLIGHPLDFMFAHLGAKDVQTCVDTYKERYRLISKEKTILLPKAKEAVELASKFAKLGVVTTKTGRYSKELLEYLGLMHYFGVLIGREDVIHPKPDPEPIRKAMHHLGALAEHTWMVGDTCLDIHAAKNAGIRSIALSCGYRGLHELQECADIVKQDALEAVSFIRRIETFDDKSK